VLRPNPSDVSYARRIPLADGRSARGTAERYSVLVVSSKDFPEDFRCRFTDFLHGLHLQPIELTQPCAVANQGGELHGFFLGFTAALPSGWRL
jgi:hypothetical protein